MATNEPQKEPELTIEAAPESQKAQDAKPLSVLAEMKKQVREDDTPAKDKRRLRDIVGGDFLTKIVHRHIWLILLLVVLTTCYIAVRYQCQQDKIDIINLEQEVNDMKFKALSSSSDLTVMCRQSNLEQLLRNNQDTLFRNNMEPPFRIDIPENE